MKYWAFLSYSHTDKKWGDWLHKALETYRVPRQLVGKESRDGKIPSRLFPIFRDREELPVSSDLGLNINEALRESRYLIVICSPRAARSRWVDEEITQFKKLGREDRVLAFIVDGEPNASDGKPGFERADECFPEPMRYRLASNGDATAERTEPIAADARPNKDGRQNAKLKVLAGLLSVNFDDLKRRDQRRRIRRRVAILLVSGLLISLVGGVWFFQEATKRRLAARAQAQTERGARSDEARAQELFAAGHWRQGILHLFRAVRHNSSGAGVAALWQALVYGRGDRDALPEWIVPIEAGERIVFSPDGRYLLCGSANHTQIFDIAARKSVGGKLVGRILARCNFTADSKAFVLLTAGDCLELIDTATGSALGKKITAEGRITSAALLPDGSTLIVATEKAPVRTWDLRTQELRGDCTTDPTPQSTILLSSDGRTLVTATSPESLTNPIVVSSQTLRFWDVDKRTPLGPAYKYSISTNSIPFSADGRRLLIHDANSRLCVIDVPTGRMVAGPWEQIGPDDCAALSPDGRFVAVGNVDGEVTVHGVALEGFVDRTPKQSSLIQELRFTQDSRALMIATSDGEAVLWDFVRSLPATEKLRHRGAVIAVDVNAKNRLIATLQRNDAVRLWAASSRAEDGTTIVLPKGYLGATQDYLRLVLKREGRLELWDVAKGKTTAILEETINRCDTNTTWSADHRFLFTSCRRTGDGTLWDLSTEQPKGVPLRHGTEVLPQPSSSEGRAAPVFALSHSIFSPDGAVLATAGGDGKVRFWNVPSTSSALPPLEFPLPIKVLTWSADGKRLAIATGWRWWKDSGRSDQVHVWDLSSNKQSGPVLNPGPEIDRMVFSPTGTILVTLQRGPTRFWDFLSGQPRQGPAEEVSTGIFSFSPDGSKYVTGGRFGREAYLWDSKTDRRIGSPMQTEHYFNTLDWSPDGKWIATGTWDEGGGPLVGHVQVWDGSTGRPVGVAWKHPNNIARVEWTADGRTLTVAESRDALHRYNWCLPGVPGPWIDDLIAAETGLRFSEQQSAEEVPVEERLAARSRVIASHQNNPNPSPPNCDWTHFLESWSMSPGQRERVTMSIFDDAKPTPASQSVPAMSASQEELRRPDGTATATSQKNASLDRESTVGWLIADSSDRRLSPEELRDFTPEKLWRARNEIFARRGLIFSTDRGRALAKSLGSLYHGTDPDQARVLARMSNIERANVTLLKKLEDERNQLRP